jgi:septal ring factor EnvC (AmiA/AmiB activator)
MLKKLPLKWLVICLLCIFTANSYAAKKIDAAKEDLSDLHEKIDAIKKELDQNQEAHKDAADSLKESETAISAANRKLREITQKQNQNKNALNTLKKQSLTINERLNQQQKQLSALLKQQYMRGNQSYAQLILQDKNPSEIARDVKYFSYIAKEHATLIDDMQASLNKVKDLNNQTAAALQKVAELKAKQEAEKKELEAQKKEKAQTNKKTA